jgi:hypothetical protein
MKGQGLLYLDQSGYKYWAENLKELKKEVCPYTNYPKTSIMYQDKKDGTTVRVGYIISDHWLTAYIPWEQTV